MKIVKVIMVRGDQKVEPSSGRACASNPATIALHVKNVQTDTKGVKGITFWLCYLLYNRNTSDIQAGCKHNVTFNGI